MSEPLHNLEKYWADLGNSKPVVQVLEGVGTNPVLAETPTMSRPAVSYNNTFRPS